METVAPITIVNNYGGTSNQVFITNEILTGVSDSLNKIFFILTSPIVNTEMIFINGVLQVRGSDYQINGNQLTFTLAPYSTDVLTTSYFKTV